MFVLLTLENLPVYIEMGQEISNWTLLFFISYVLIASFLIFNLFIGIPWERLHALKHAVEGLERELAAQRRAR
jgi:hypothetical protein